MDAPICCSAPPADSGAGSAWAGSTTRHPNSWLGAAWATPSPTENKTCPTIQTYPPAGGPGIMGPYGRGVTLVLQPRRIAESLQTRERRLPNWSASSWPAKGCGAAEPTRSLVARLRAANV